MDLQAIINLENSPAPAPGTLFQPTDLEIVTVYLPMKKLGLPVRKMPNLWPVKNVISPYTDPEFYFDFIGLDKKKECYFFDTQSYVVSMNVNWYLLGVTTVRRNPNQTIGLRRRYEFRVEENSSTGWIADVYSNVYFPGLKMVKLCHDQGDRRVNIGGSGVGNAGPRGTGGGSGAVSVAGPRGTGGGSRGARGGAVGTVHPAGSVADGSVADGSVADGSLKKRRI